MHVLYLGLMGRDLYVAHGLVSLESTYLFLRRRDGRYLGGQWDIPGGTVEAGESSADAAIRECLEETGLDTVCGDLISHYRNPDTEGRDLTFHTMTYRLILNQNKLVPDVKLSAEEHNDARWLSLEDAFELPLVWHVRRTLYRSSAEQSENIFADDRWQN